MILEKIADVEIVGVRQEEIRVLLTRIDQLSTRHREVLLIVDMHGYSYGEAAQILGLSQGTIKSRLCQARMALRDRLVEVGLMPGPPA